ncbi:MAG: hypothetical protein K2Z81_00840, partial [Cyanobacteria bacterium]|nr:hypothetical protein [Cyanobacteriota bacterium]
GAVARTDKDILEAETRLLNPESRLEQRLLWFHAPPEELPAELTARSAFEMAQQWSQLNGPTTLHDAAVLMYFASIVESPDCKREDLWKQTLDMWRRVVEDEQYWSAMCSVEETLGYEPACLPGEVMAWREELLGLVTAPLLVLSRHAMHENNNDVVARVARLLGNDEKASSELVQELFRQMDGATVRLDAIMSKVIAKEEDYDKNIALNASICSEAEEVYNKLVPGILTQAESVLDKGDPELLHLREAAASILIDIAQAASWAADFELADRVLSKARPLASGTAAEPKLHDSETKLENARASHEVTKGSKPIKSAPPLMTINTFGFMVYPAMGEQADVVYGSKRAIYYLVALFIPLFPIASYRVVFLPGGSYRFLCKVPLDRAARIHQAVVALLIGLLVFSVATYKPDPRVVAANTSKVVARVTFPGAEKVQLPDDKYSLRDIVNEDEEALDDLEGQLKQVKAQCEKMAPRLEKSQNKLKSILPSEPTDSSESAAAIKYNNDGVTCLKSSDFKGAIVNFEKALSTDPKYQIAMANLAIAYNNLALAQSKSEPKLSVSSFYRSLCFDLYNKTTWQNLDSMLKYLGKHPEQAKERLALAEKAKAAHDYRAAAIEYLAVLKVKQDPKVAHDKVKSKLEEVIAKLPAPEQSALKASLNQERDNPEVAELKRKHNAMVDRYNALLADGDKKYAVMKKILDERNKAAEKYNKLYADK